MYICCTTTDAEAVPQLVQTALDNGATAVLMPAEAEGLEGLVIPAEMPCRYVLNVPEVAQRLAVAFYGGWAY